MTLVLLGPSARADDSTSLHRLSAFGEAGPASLGFVVDGFHASTGNKGLGAGAGYLFGDRWGRVGLGFRYATILGERPWPTWEPRTVHIVSLPLLASLVFPVGRAGAELHFVVGIGPSWGWVVAQDPLFVDGGTTLHFSGFTFEAMFGYAHPLSSAVDFVGEIGVRLDPSHTTNGAGMFKEIDGAYGVIPIRLGVRWKL